MTANADERYKAFLFYQNDLKASTHRNVPDVDFAHGLAEWVDVDVADALTTREDYYRLVAWWMGIQGGTRTQPPHQMRTWQHALVRAIRGLRARGQRTPFRHWLLEYARVERYEVADADTSSQQLVAPVRLIADRVPKLMSVLIDGRLGLTVTGMSLPSGIFTEPLAELACESFFAWTRATLLQWRLRELVTDWERVVTCHFANLVDAFCGPSLVLDPTEDDGTGNIAFQPPPVDGPARYDTWFYAVHERVDVSLLGFLRLVPADRVVATFVATQWAVVSAIVAAATHTCLAFPTFGIEHVGTRHAGRSAMRDRDWIYATADPAVAIVVPRVQHMNMVVEIVPLASTGIRPLADGGDRYDEEITCSLAHYFASVRAALSGTTLGNAIDDKLHATLTQLNGGGANGWRALPILADHLRVMTLEEVAMTPGHVLVGADLGPGDPAVRHSTTAARHRKHTRGTSSSMRDAKRARYHHAVPLGATPWSPARVGFAKLRETALTPPVVTALRRLRERYGALYAYAPAWFDNDAGGMIHTRNELLTVPRKQEKSDVFLRIFRQWLTGAVADADAVADSYQTLLPNAALRWPAVAAEAARLFAVCGRISPEMSNYMPTLLLIDVHDADLRRVMDGCPQTMLRIHPLPGVPVRGAPRAAVGADQLVQMLRVHLAFQAMRVRWPLAVCLNLASSHDMLVAPTPSNFSAGLTPDPRNVPAMSEAHAADDKAHGYALWMFEPLGVFSLETVYRRYGEYFQSSKASAREASRLPTPLKVTTAWLLNVLWQTTFAVRAVLQLFGFENKDWARKHVMFTDMRGTPYANRPWAFRLRGQRAYVLLPPEAHQNYLVKLIDFGMSELATPLGDGDDDATARPDLERFAVDDRLHLPTMITAFAKHEESEATAVAVKEAMGSYLALYDGDERERWPDVANHHLFMHAHVTIVPADDEGVRAANDAIAMLDPTVPVLVGFVPDISGSVTVEDAGTKRARADDEESVEPDAKKPNIDLTLED
jgi:hypothetical protein